MELVRYIQKLVERAWRIFFGNQDAAGREQEIEDLLSSHADRLIGHAEADQEITLPYPTEPELSALMSLAALVNVCLQPIRPAAGFQSRLLHDLMRQAHAQLGRNNYSLWKERHREIIIGATITSLISAVGVVAYLMRVTPFNRPPTSTG